MTLTVAGCCGGDVLQAARNAATVIDAGTATSFAPTKVHSRSPVPKCLKELCRKRFGCPSWSFHLTVARPVCRVALEVDHVVVRYLDVESLAVAILFPGGLPFQAQSITDGSMGPFC